MQVVEYENLAHYCNKCQLQGHNSATCIRFVAAQIGTNIQHEKNPTKRVHVWMTSRVLRLNTLKLESVENFRKRL